MNMGKLLNQEVPQAIERHKPGNYGREAEMSGAYEAWSWMSKSRRLLSSVQVNPKMLHKHVCLINLHFFIQSQLICTVLLDAA